jgi:ribonuclease P protein component
MRHTLSKPERLTGKKTLSELYQSGEVIKEYPFILMVKPFPFENNVPARLAISVPKRKVKLAVKRNLMKRLAREAYRKQKNEFFDAIIQNKTQLALLLIYTGDEKFNNDIAEIKITKLLSRLIRKLSPQHPII